MKLLVLLVVAAHGMAPPPPKVNKPSNKDLILGNWELVQTSQGGGWVARCSTSNSQRTGRC
jgi:hypothetical protein